MIQDQNITKDLEQLAIGLVKKFEKLQILSKKDFNEIYASSLRAHSIYIVKSDKIFSRVLNTDRLILDYRIRDIKFSKSCIY